MRRHAPSGSLRQLGEFGLINRFRRLAGRKGVAVLQGIGEDDAAVVRLDRGRLLLLTTDLLTEGIHFDLDTATMADVGYKAAMSNISDIAAMGGIPQYMLVGVAIPEHHTVSKLDQLYKGLIIACRHHGVQLIGGDTSASACGLFICITVTGITRASRPLTRAGARVGDHLYVTGTLGDARAGLTILMTRQGRRARSTSSSEERHMRFLAQRHLRPSARVREGQLLATNGLATACLDVSDGLSGDLAHLCQQSRVGAVVESGSLPLSPACRWYATRHHLDPAQLALAGGEDYELLFTVRPNNQQKLERLAHRYRLRFTRIGSILPEARGIKVKPLAGALRRLTAGGYQHFRTSP